jgi:poly(3-hydroxyalkanoate) synthetase
MNPPRYDVIIIRGACWDRASFRTSRFDPGQRRPVETAGVSTMAKKQGEAPRVPEFSSLFAWPAMMAASVGEAIAASFAAPGAQPGAANAPQPVWTTPHRVRLELGTVMLRDFSTGEGGVPVLICAPFALHYATIADFAPGHSVVEALHDGGVGRIYVTDWRTAGPDMRFLSIDNYLADLNVAVDEIGPPVDLVGLCQGGWMALTYAARFAHKVRRLVLAGAPVDIAAGKSNLSQMTVQIPLAAFEEFVGSQGGRVLGRRVLQIWGTSLIADDTRRVLQLPPDDESTRMRELEARFKEWYDLTVDLPGTYYLQVVSWLYQQNRLATGNFVALGRRIDLSALRHPIFLLGASGDEIVAPDQLFATAKRVGTPKEQIETATESCGHLSLFLGAGTIRNSWPRIAHWLGEERQVASQDA